MLNWKKKGRIYVPDEKSAFFKSHASRPVPVRLNEDIIRIYYSSRDTTDTIYPTYIDVSSEDPACILGINDRTLFNLGDIGCFDDSGITPGSIVEHEDHSLMFYTGWKRRRINVTFELSVGVVRFDKALNKYDRLYKGPIIGQSYNVPYLAGGPFVLFEKGLFRMWLCLGTGWIVYDNNPEPLYKIHYAESKNLINWEIEEMPCIDYEFDGQVVSAPWVVKKDGYYWMFYSVRGSGPGEKNYETRLAVSKDGLVWEKRRDLSGLDRGPEKWDSLMTCYVATLDVGDRMLAFYSGNSVGKGGMGYAEMV